MNCVINKKFFEIFGLTFYLGMSIVFATGLTKQNSNYPCQNKTETEYVFVEGGEFFMGSTEKDKYTHPDEFPCHKVILSSYYIGKYEVTNKEFCDFLNSVEDSISNNEFIIDLSDRENCKIRKRNGLYTVVGGFENYPVVCINWDGANEYCKWVGGRLPTEAEWEYAAKGGKKSKGYRFVGGNNVEEVANCAKDFSLVGTLCEVGCKKPNELGIYNMSANVHEYCSDWYGENYYSVSELNDPQGPKTGKCKVIRGGAYYLPFFFCRPTNRACGPAGKHKGTFHDGFRICFDYEDNDAQ